MIHFFVFPRRKSSSPLLPITSLQALQFQAVTHSFPQRRTAISFIFSGFRTLFIATGVVPPSRPTTLVQTFGLVSISFCRPLFSYPYKPLFPQLLISQPSSLP